MAKKIPSSQASFGSFLSRNRWPFAIVLAVTVFTYSFYTLNWVSIALNGGMIAPTWCFSDLVPSVLIYLTVGVVVSFIQKPRETSGKRRNQSFIDYSFGMAATTAMLPLYTFLLTGGFDIPVVSGLVKHMLAIGATAPLVRMSLFWMGAVVGLGATVLLAAAAWGGGRLSQQYKNRALTLADEAPRSSKISLQNQPQRQSISELRSTDCQTSLAVMQQPTECQTSFAVMQQPAEYQTSFAVMQQQNSSEQQTLIPQAVENLFMQEVEVNSYSVRHQLVT